MAQTTSDTSALEDTNHIVRPNRQAHQTTQHLLAKRAKDLIEGIREISRRKAERLVKTKTNACIGQMKYT